MSKAQPIQAANAPLFDMSKAKPIESASPPKSLYQQARESYDAQHGNVGMPGVSEGAGLAGGLAEWDKASGGEIIGGLRDLFSGNVAKGLHRIITGGGAALAPAAPFAVAGAPVAAALGVAGGAVGGKVGQAGATALGATPDQAALAGDVGSLAGGLAGGAAPSVVRAAGRPALAKVGSAATAIGESLDPDIVGLVSPRLAHGLRLASKVGKVATKLGAEAPEAEAAAVPEAVTKPAPKTGISQENLESIRQGGAEMRRSNAQFVQDVIKRQGLPPATPEMAAEEAARKGGDIARAQKYPVKPTGMVRDPFAAEQPIGAPGNSVPEAYPGEGASIKSGLDRAEANQPLNKRISDVIDQHIPKESLSNTQAKAALEKLLSDAMGGQTLEKGVPLRNQTAAGGVAAEAPASTLPAGFTPVESKAVGGYKYNPAAKEFEVISKNGQHYVYGDVSPEQEAAYETADSKGTAWNEMRNSPGVTLVAKIINGKRIAIKPTVKGAVPAQ